MPPASTSLTATPTWQERFYSRGLNRLAGRAAQLAGKAFMGTEAAIAPTIDPVRMTAKATITTPTPDRSDDVVHPMGVQLDNYRKNPVVFYDHQCSGIFLPIGKSEDAEGNLLLEVTEAGIDATTFFSQKLLESAQVFGLIEEGIIKSTSIGFIPLEAKPRGETGLEITLWELLEYSWVGIPDNPEAVRKVLDRGRLAGSAFCDPIQKMLTQFAAPVVKAGRGLPRPTEIKAVSKINKNDPPEDETVADETPVDETKGDEPVDETVDGEPGETEKPLGMQVMGAIRSALKVLGDQLAAAEGPLENPAVKEYVSALKETIGGCMTELEGKFSEAYPDGKFDEPEPEEDTSVAKFLASSRSNQLQLHGIARELKSIPKLTPMQKRAIDRAAGRLSAIAETAKKSMPKPEDPAAKELAEVKSTIKSLVKKFEDILPASKS